MMLIVNLRATTENGREVVMKSLMKIKTNTKKILDLKDKKNKLTTTNQIASQMVDLNLTISIFSININRPNHPT